MPSQITLDDDDWKRLLKELVNPSPPNAKLKALMRRKPIWEK